MDKNLLKTRRKCCFDRTKHQETSSLCLDVKYSFKKLSFYMKINLRTCKCHKEFNSCHMWCVNICLRCGEQDEAVTYAIFECPPALQVWVLAATLSHLNIFSMSVIYTNMDYFFWQKYWRTEDRQRPSSIENLLSLKNKEW